MRVRLFKFMVQVTVQVRDWSVTFRPLSHLVNTTPHVSADWPHHTTIAYEAMTSPHLSRADQQHTAVSLCSVPGDPAVCWSSLPPHPPIRIRRRPCLPALSSGCDPSLMVTVQWARAVRVERTHRLGRMDCRPLFVTGQSQSQRMEQNQSLV